jgi:hypothetical protein
MRKNKIIMNPKERLLLFFEQTNFSPRSGMKDAMTIFLWWFMSAFIFVFIVQWLSKYRSVKYLSQAINDGIGPNLWNVIGIFGFSLFGAALLFPNQQYVSFAANRVLTNVYAVGSLMFGLLLGQLVSGMSESSLTTWQTWLFGSAFIFLFILVLFINFATWYLSFLIYDSKGKTSFVTNVEKLGIWWRIGIGLMVLLLPLYLMLAER